MELKLPLSIVSRFDVSRLLRELNTLDDFFAGNKVQPAGSKLPLPRLSRLLNELANENRINLLDEPQRRNLQQVLQQLLKQAPQLQISFSVEPAPKTLEKILAWLRQNIDPFVLLQVGLQPNVSAGFMLRTPNKWFDLSLRPRFEQQRPYLTELISGADHGR